MNVEPKALVRRLSPTATQRLETAVGKATLFPYTTLFRSRSESVV